MKTITTVVSVWLVLCAATDARAQMVWGEFGRQQNVFGNGASLEGLGWGFGLQMTIGGDSSSGKGFAVPVGMELRSDTNFGALDFLGVGDLAFRVKNVSFGPGGNFGYIMRDDMADPRCFRTTPGSSCYGDGTRDVGNFFGIGLSGFIKGTFGPQGRAFAQLRYIHYHSDWMFFRSSAEMLNAQLGTTFDVPTDFPTFESGRDIRLSGGWVFGGADSMAKLIRVQYTDKQFNFTRERANFDGMFDQTGRQLSVGFGFGW